MTTDKVWMGKMSSNAEENIRWRWVEGRPFPYVSVTSALSIIVEDGLKSWFINTDRAVIERVSKTATDRGTRIHEIIEAINSGKTVVVEAEHADVIKEYRHFIAELKPKFLHIEKRLYHDKYGYSGAADAIVDLNGRIEIWDFKTSKTANTQMGWQLGAYKLAAESMGMHIDGMRIVHVDIRLKKIKSLDFEHHDFCTARFLKALDEFKSAYFNKLSRGIEVPNQKEKAVFPLDFLLLDSAYDFVDNLPEDRKAEYLRKEKKDETKN